MLNKRGVVPYPRWIRPRDGSPSVIVNSSAEETAITGELLDEAGDPVDLHEDHPDTLPPDAKAIPPTLETVIKAGYAPDVAAQIVEREQFRFNAGYPPYGTTPEVAVPPDAAPVTPEQIAKLAEIEKSNLDKLPAIVEAGQVEVPPEVIKAGDGW